MEVNNIKHIRTTRDLCFISLGLLLYDELLICFYNPPRSLGVDRIYYCVKGDVARSTNALDDMPMTGW